MRLSKLRTGLTSLFLLLSLSACVATPSKPVVLLPPAQFTEIEPVAKFDGSTNKDLLRYVRELQAGWSACNDDKAAIRTWEAQWQSSD